MAFTPSCRRVFLYTAAATLVVTVVFLSIPVPVDDYNDVLHVNTCQPSPQKYSPILHQIWLNYSSFPEEWNIPISECLALNKNITYMRWSAAAILQFLTKEYPWILDTYQSYTYNVQRVDAARLFLLYHFGGVYMDMDIGCVKTFEDIFHEKSDYDVIVSRGRTFGLSNHIMMAKPRHPYLKLAIESLPKYNRWFVLPYITIMASAGPLFLTIILRHYPCKEQVYVFPPEPLHNEYYINLHGGTWHTWDTKIIDILGTIHKTIKHCLTWNRFTALIFLSVTVYLIYRMRKRGTCIKRSECSVSMTKDGCVL